MKKNKVATLNAMEQSLLQSIRNVKKADQEELQKWGGGQFHGIRDTDQQLAKYYDFFDEEIDYKHCLEHKAKYASMLVQVWNEKEFIGNGVIYNRYECSVYVMLIDGEFKGRTALAQRVEGNMFDTTCVLKW